MNDRNVKTEHARNATNERGGLHRFPYKPIFQSHHCADLVSRPPCLLLQADFQIPPRPVFLKITKGMRQRSASPSASVASARAPTLRRMPPLITFEEALELGELGAHEDIERLVEVAWQVRQDNFGESTDMCSLVNAKSGGCAEDCGFCAQSKYADAETPMHSLMEPEQILEHARAAEAAGAHRFCLVTQGQGLSKRDFAKVLEGTRLVAEHTNLKRCASVGHMSGERARQLKDAGVQRVHHNVETARSYYDEVSTTVRYEGRIRTISAVREAGLETCVGGILNLGETRGQRIEMAFELAELDPTSVPINLLNPRSGTKFGDRELIDPWEAVKFIAIFRLVLPDALFRLCGGRVENLGELQPLAVKAGLNGVMMGNFLTTLGSEPEEDRGMFEELGLNVARQHDNGANPRPDNRGGWLEGDPPSTPVDDLIRKQSEASFWDPSTQLRLRRKSKPPPYPQQPPAQQASDAAGWGD
jgi:biotin synthase